MLKSNSVLNFDNGLANPTYSRVREKLREDIISGYFASGKRLKIAELVARYGVSQMPIREALQQLQGEGIVIIEPNKGAHVRQIDEHFLENMYDIRLLIEVYLTVKSADHLTSKELKQLQLIQIQYEKSAAKKDYVACLNHNKSFHAVIYKLADNPEGIQILERHWQLINSLRQTYGFGKDRTAEIIHEHRAIITALESKDKNAIETAATAHCLNARTDLVAQMKLK
ncbi:MAG: GntR family transcriptional regulator [Mucilaginibacter sp.]|uniref:GntR family transcriptional regulator n=1 Tax=Mucilaginibacter sp. TaxID=1882438 RepID=UPI003263BD67